MVDFRSAIPGSFSGGVDNGEIVAGGYSFGDFALARYDPDGTLDRSFGSGGKVTTDFSGSGSFEIAFAIAIQSDGKIVATGPSDASGSYDFALARYNSNGTLDASFGSAGIVMTDFSGSGSFDWPTALGHPSRRQDCGGRRFRRRLRVSPVQSLTLPLLGSQNRVGRSGSLDHLAPFL